MMLQRVGALSGVVLAVLAPGASGQDVVQLSPGCEGCRIVLDTLAVLGDAEGGGVLEQESLRLTVDAEGRYYVATQPATSIQVFGPDGSFLRTDGRDGDGPGEFRMIQGIHVDRAGRLYLMDTALQRVTVFGPDLEPERTVRIAEFTPAFDLLSARGDSLIVSGYSLAPHLVGDAVHVVSPDGERARSFGSPGHAPASADPYFHIRSLAAENEGRLWISSRDRYRVELWDRDGRRLATFSRDVDWFDPRDPVPDAPPPPRAVIGSVRQDPSGLVWMVARVPTDRWHEAARPSSTAPHGWEMVDDDLWVSTVVDVFDPAAREWLASVRLPRRYTGVFGDGLIGRVRWNETSDALEILVLRMRVVGRYRSPVSPLPPTKGGLKSDPSPGSA